MRFDKVSKTAQLEDGVVQREAPEYTTNRRPRRNPINVRPSSRANCTARLEGADTEASIGIPAEIAFCTISNPPRPLTSITCSESGTRPSNNAQPITLSTAL